MIAIVITGFKDKISRHHYRVIYSISMDFLDPVQFRRHNRMIIIGYISIAFAIAMATAILVLLASGYWFNKKGEVIQNGLMFVSSTPAPADVYLNGVRNKSQTNSRIVLPEGNYNMELKRDGYRTWQRPVQINGNTVVHFDYPFLVPNNLVTTPQKTYDVTPTLVSQSPDRRWLITAAPGDMKQFELYDTKDPKNVAATAVAVPAGLLTASTEAQSWNVQEWSNDNRHVLLKHLFGANSEYILLDRSAPDQSVNLTKTLGTNPTELQLVDKKYDRYYLYDAASHTLSKASLGAPQPTPFLERVLSFKSYGSDTLLYAVTPSADSDNNVTIKMMQGSQTYTIRQFPAGTSYLVNMAIYDGDMYVVTAAANGDRAYIYRNPIDQINNKNFGTASPIRVLRMSNPNYLEFSANTRFILAENGDKFAVYDAEDDRSYAYTAADPLDAPQAHAIWMDGHHLTYVSGGKFIMFDYDHQNRQELVDSLPTFTPLFDSTYRYLYSYTAVKNDASKMVFSQTALRLPQDL